MKEMVIILSAATAFQHH